MRKIKSRQNRKYIYAAVSAVIAVSSALAIWLLFFNNAAEKTTDSAASSSSSNEQTYTPPTEEEKQGETTTEQDARKDQQLGDGDGQTTDAKIHITFASQNASTYTIRTIVPDTTLQGKCELRILKGTSAIYRQTVDTQLVADNTTCRGFDFSVADFDRGTYDAKIVFTNAETTATTIKTIEVVP